jgi:hypothetical protein
LPVAVELSWGGERRRAPKEFLPTAGQGIWETFGKVGKQHPADAYVSNGSERAGCGADLIQAGVRKTVCCYASAGGPAYASFPTISCTRSVAKCVTPYLIGVPSGSTSTFSTHSTGC